MYTRAGNFGCAAVHRAPPPPPPITKHMCLNSKLCINMTQALGLADNMHPISRGGGGGGGVIGHKRKRTTRS